MADKPKAKSSRRKIFQLERTLNEVSPRGKPVEGENYRETQRSTEPLVGQNTPYTQTTTPQSSTEPVYHKPEDYSPTVD